MTSKSDSKGQSIAVIGAGDLVSHVHRGADGGGVANYRFSVLRLTENGQATHELRSSDIHDLVKLCQVLAFAITDDGWLPTNAQHALLSVLKDLDQLTQSRSESKDG